MRIAALLLLLSVQDEDRPLRFFERTRFVQVDPSSGEARAVLDVLQKQEHWMGAYRLLEQKFGQFPIDLQVRVDFELRGVEMAKGSGYGSEGRVSFNLERLTAFQKRLDELERERQAAARDNRTLTFKVPPARIDRMIYHELTHVLQRSYPAPLWFNEGMAQLVADDPNSIRRFAYLGKEVQPIDVPGLDIEDHYARGQFFWTWLQSKEALQKVFKAAFVERRPWKDALEEGVGMSWLLMIHAEREWSAKECDKIRPRK